MKFLGLLGSLAFIVWLVTFIALTWYNISRTVFGHVFENEAGIRFWMRQIMIIVWPLALASEHGRYALYVIWTGKDDKCPPGRPDLDPSLWVEGDSFRTKSSEAKSSGRRRD